MMLTDGTVLPPIVVIPMAGLTILIILAHLVALRASPEMPLSRKRIRSSSAVVMLITTIVLAYAFGFARIDDPRQFTLSWFSAVMLLMMVLLLATLDAANNIRLARIHKERIRKAARDLHHAIVEAHRAQNASGEPDS